MSTGFDVTADGLMALLGETVERGASLMSGGERLAGPATIQESSSELVPGPGCVGVGAELADGVVVAVMITNTLAVELFGVSTPGDVAAGLQVVITELATGLSMPIAASYPLVDGDNLVSFIGARPLVMGAGIFDGETVVATVAAAHQLPQEPRAGSAPAPIGAVPDTVTPPAAAPAAADAEQPAVAADLPRVAPAPSVVPTVSDAVLARGLALLADVSLSITAELGRTSLRVSELLGLEPGSVIELDREAGSPVDLLVNGSLFARAEVIVVDGNYAVRICELITKDAHL